MWVYGDREVDWCIAQEAARLTEDWRIASLLPPGLPRHAMFVRMLIRAGMIWQARADAEFAAAGVDTCPEIDAPDRVITLACASLVQGSVATEMQNLVEDFPRAAFDDLMRDQRVLRTRIPEGFAFYDLYPEFMIAPASRLSKGEGTRVIGLRSIGTSLAAIVAAIAETPHVSTLRPHGEPFDRRVNVDDEWQAMHRNAGCIAIADEGPGLSGSSFAAAGRAAREAAGRDAVVFLPTHGGNPGVAAVSCDREAWMSARKEVADRSLFDGGAFARANWFSDITGEPERVTDLSGGLWRSHLYGDTTQWPPADPMQERVKLRIETKSGAWLMKFSGLTPLSEDHFDLAKKFAAQGFGLTPQAERHGMTLWPWQEDARPLTRADKDEALPFIARMLAFRAREWRCDEGGASVADLYEMARTNLVEGIGAEGEFALGPWRDRLCDFARAARPVRIDGRLDPHEFLRLLGGQIVKTDALDHHAAHDLVGCQDILWDVAGAAVEWQFSASETRRLMDRMEESGARLTRDAFPFYKLAYLAFRLGGAVMAMESLAGTMPVEAQRFKCHADGYRAAFQSLMHEKERA